MKHTNHSTGIIITLFIASIIVNPDFVASEENDGGLTIAFSEILFSPAQPSGSKWIELRNHGNSEIPMHGWCITDFNGNSYEINLELEPVPPQGQLLIYFPSSQPEENDDLSFQNGNRAVLYCREAWSNDFLRGNGNGIALYTSGQQNASELVDFVCWDRDNQSNCKVKNDAVEKGLIRSSAGGVYVGNHALPGDLPSLKSGGSIGRINFSKINLYNTWHIYQPFEISPGKQNPRPAPYLYAPTNNSGILLSGEFDYYPVVWRDPAGIHDSARVQIAIDPDFYNLILDQWIKTDIFLDRYRVSEVLYPGTFYCRVRFESGGNMSHWSEPVKYTLISSQASVNDWEKVNQ